MFKVDQYEYWLLVEESDDEHWQFGRACARAFDAPPWVHRERNAAAAIEFLQNTARAPSLIISDVTMPGIGGLELLDWVRQEPGLRDVNFVLLSTCSVTAEIKRARELLVDCYLIKPSIQSEYVHLVRMLALGAETQTGAYGSYRTVAL